MKRHSLLLIFGLLPSLQSLGAINIEYHIHGASKEALDNIQERLNLLQDSLENEQDDKRKLNYFSKQAPKEIRKSLEPFGYFQPTIQTQYSHNNNTWNFYYQIQLNTPTRINQLDLTIEGPGKHAPYFSTFINHYPLQPGQIFQSETYIAQKEQLFKLSMEHGFLKNRFDISRVFVNKQQHEANIILHFNTGAQYYFGKPQFSDTPLNLNFLNKFIQFRQGDLYDNNKLHKLQEDLDNSGYFDQVIVTPSLPDRDNPPVDTSGYFSKNKSPPLPKEQRLIPIEINMIPKQRRTYSLGLGYGTNTDLRTKLNLEVPILNDIGHKFGTELTASRIGYTSWPKNLSLSAYYKIPGAEPAKQLFTFSGLVKRTEFKSNLLKNRSTTNSISSSYTVSKGAWQRTFGLSLLHERFMVEDIPTQQTTILTPSVQWLRMKSDHPIYPNRGSILNLSVRGSHSLIRSSRDFAQFQLHGKILRTLTTTDRIVAKGAIAYTAVEEIMTMPLTYQLFAGGTESIRGYAFNALGPGRYLFSTSIEEQHQLVGRWYATAFFDVGEVFPGIEDLKNFPNDHRFHRAFGLGLLWRSPVGDLQLSYAKPFDGSTDEQQRWQFSMGPEL